MINYYKQLFLLSFLALLIETFYILKLSDTNVNPLVGTAIIASSFFKENDKTKENGVN